MPERLRSTANYTRAARFIIDKIIATQLLGIRDPRQNRVGWNGSSLVIMGDATESQILDNGEWATTMGLIRGAGAVISSLEIIVDYRRGDADDNPRPKKILYRLPFLEYPKCRCWKW